MADAVKIPTPVEQITLVERREEYTDTYTYLFRSENPISFIAGQYAHIRVTTLPETERRTREISFASAPSDELLQFGIDARSHSPYQEALKALAPGQSIELFKIKGHMTWPTPSAHAVMIAGGVGVTPFRSMLRDAKQRGLSITTTLVQVAREHFLYADELKHLATEHLTTDRGGLSAILDRIAAAHPDAHYYVAGSPNFVSSMIAEIRERGAKTYESDEFDGLTEESA